MNTRTLVLSAILLLIAALSGTGNVSAAGVCTGLPGADYYNNPCPQNCGNPKLFQCLNCDVGVFHFHKCISITVAPPLPQTIPTEIGTFGSDPAVVIYALTRIFVGLAGGVSLLLLISGAAKYLMSTGNPDAIEEAKGTITHALGGFLLVFLSVFLLRFVGVDLLNIPGLTVSPGGGVNIP